MTATASPSDAQQAQGWLFFAPPSVVPLGGDTFRLVPGKLEEKLRPKLAAKRLGVCPTVVYEMLRRGEFRDDEWEQPSERVIWITAAAVARVKALTQGSNAKAYWAAARASGRLARRRSSERNGKN